MKLVVNMVMGSMMATFAEGLALTEGAGLSQQEFIEVQVYQAQDKREQPLHFSL